MLSSLVITFLPRSKRLLISWLQSPSAVILEPPKIKSDTVSTVSPSISHALNQLIWAFCCTLLDLILTILLLLSHFSHVQLFVTLLTVAHQAPLSMGYSKQEYWSVLSCSPPGAPLHPGIRPVSLPSPALAGGFFTTSTSWGGDEGGLTAVITQKKVQKRTNPGNFPDGPVAKTLCSQCRGPGFNPWSGN